jgi:hypothetical protein
VLVPEIDEVPVTANVGVEEPENVIPLTVVGVIAPRVNANAPAVFDADTPLPVVTEETRVPLVGNVTLVAPVVVRVRELAPLVASVDPAAMFKVFVPLAVMVKPLIVPPEIAPLVVIVSDPVSIDPNPEVMLPAFNAPTVVNDEVTTLDANVVPEISAAALNVIEAFGSVYVRADVRSALVIVPVKAFAPAAVTVMASESELAVALSIVSPRTVAPPVNDDAVEVVAPRPVTEERVSVSAVRKVPELTFSITPVPVFLVNISYPPALAVGEVVNVTVVAKVGAVPKTKAPLPVSSLMTPAS